MLGRNAGCSEGKLGTHSVDVLGLQRWASQGAGRTGSSGPGSGLVYCHVPPGPALTDHLPERWGHPGVRQRRRKPHILEINQWEDRLPSPQPMCLSSPYSLFSRPRPELSCPQVRNHYTQWHPAARDKETPEMAGCQFLSLPLSLFHFFFQLDEWLEWGPDTRVRSALHQLGRTRVRAGSWLSLSALPPQGGSWWLRAVVIPGCRCAARRLAGGGGDSKGTVGPFVRRATQLQLFTRQIHTDLL